MKRALIVHDHPFFKAYNIDTLAYLGYHETSYHMMGEFLLSLGYDKVYVVLIRPSGSLGQYLCRLLRDHQIEPHVLEAQEFREMQ